MAKIGRKVVCAMSGGVDSSVSAYLLKSSGYRVHGVFMRNWDAREETGMCSADKDAADAKQVCKLLEIPFDEVSFIKEYWNEVFTEFLSLIKNGLTPNPDVLCNQHIKFKYMFKYALRNFGADYMATGHYAQLRQSAGGFVKLVTSVDRVKDQTLFLHRSPQTALRKTLFPIGHLLKCDVKQIATDIGLPNIAKKKESMGICFIGRRHFKDFLLEYINPNPGPFVDIESGKTVGTHLGYRLHSIGERARVKACSSNADGCAWFVAGKDVLNNVLYVVNSTTHPALYTYTMKVSQMRWITVEPPELRLRGKLYCKARCIHTMDPVPCTVEYFSSQSSACPRNLQCDGSFANSELDSFSDAETGDCSSVVGDDSVMFVTLQVPCKHVIPGQFVVFYLGEECLGGGQICERGSSLFELQQDDLF